MQFQKVALYSGLCADLTSDVIFSEEERVRQILPAGAQLDTVTGSYLEQSLRKHLFEDVTPRKGRELSAMELPLDLSACSPLTGAYYDVPRYLTAKTSEGHIIYGWIDGFEPVAEKGPGHNTRVLWHVDWWMIYEHWRHTPGAPVTRLTYGRIKRGPAAIKRPEPSEPRLWQYDANYRLYPQGAVTSDGPYAVALIAATSGDQTNLRLCTWDASEALGHISISAIYCGLTEEIMGLDPESIAGLWFSPIPAFMPSQDLKATNTYQGIEYTWYQLPAGNARLTGFELNVVYDAGFTELQKTDDYVKWILTDPMGSTYATLPWGVTWKYLKITVDVGSSGAFLIIHLVETRTDGVQGLGEGRTVKLPLITAPVTSNAFSSYVYSGQRDYDIRMAEIQQQAAAMSGIANIGSSAITGAVAGSIASPGIGTQAGAIAGIISSTVGSVAGYYITGDTDRKSQAAMDRLMSNQTSSVIIGAGGPQWSDDTFTLGSWRLVKMTADEVSMSSLSAEQQELGYVTDQYTADLDGDIIASQGGAYRVEEIGMAGVMPNEGRGYLSALFQRGVKFLYYD